MSAPATLARVALKALLETAVTSVRTERAALETTSATLPVLTLSSQNDVPAATSNGNPTRYRYTRALVAELKIDLTDDYETQLDAYLSAMRHALFVDSREILLAGHALSLASGEARFIEPNAQDQTAMLQLPISFDYLERTS